MVLAAIVCLSGTGLAFQPAWAADVPAAAVTGVVRDVQGIAQGGALVQVMTAGLDGPRTAITDSHGRYSIANLAPGKYAVQASAALFISATRDNLLLQPGRWAVVNLTLATLFDTSAWLPAERRKTDEPADDWKWTLRSSANRPMLRMVDDGNGGTVLASSSVTERKHEQTQGEAELQSGDGGLGHGGTHNILAANREMADGSEVILRVDAGMPAVPIGVGPSTEIDMGFGRQLGYAGASRTVIGYLNHPELVSSGGGQDPDSNTSLGMAVMQMSSAQQIALGDSIKIEAGSRIYAIRTAQTALGAEPFLRVMVQPTGDWTIGYRMATARDLQGFADLDVVAQELPVAVNSGTGSGTKLEVEHGRHQELSISRKAWRGVAQATVYHDEIDHPAIAGGGLAAIGATTLQGGVLEDPSTESFRFLGPAYSSDGVNVMVSEPLSLGMWAAVEYSNGSALTGAGVTDGMSLTDAAAALRSVRAQSATFAVKGRLIRSGTRLRAAYRWQPVGLVTAVDAYRAFSDQAYLSVAARQPIRIGRLLPPGLEGTVSVTNLLAQGYRPFLSSDGSTLFLAQSPRTLEAGLAVTF
jgi:hypothetical protein